MTKKKKKEAQPSASFSSLVLMLATGALQQMGVVENPLARKKEKDLPMAKLTIDTLEILKDKTKGNLDRDEEKMIEELVHELKLNYVKVSGI